MARVGGASQKNQKAVAAKVGAAAKIARSFIRTELSAMATDWNEVLGLELDETYRYAQEMEECEAERTPSTCGPDGEGSEGLIRRPACWWAVLLKAAGTQVGLEVDDSVSLSQGPKLLVVSSCTGCCAESLVLKAGPDHSCASE